MLSQLMIDGGRNFMLYFYVSYKSYVVKLITCYIYLQYILLFAIYINNCVVNVMYPKIQKVKTFVYLVNWRQLKKYVL